MFCLRVLLKIISRQDAKAQTKRLAKGAKFLITKILFYPVLLCAFSVQLCVTEKFLHRGKTREITEFHREIH